MRPKCKTAAVIALAFSLCVQTAEAVVVLPKGSDRPVMGYLVRQDERNVVVRQEQAGGKSRETVFARSEIEELIVTVSPDRLAELDPARPELYREYAEELAEKQRDPEARDAAIRLYAIAAVRGDEKLRHSALLGLVSLARSPEEERLFRAAAYLFGPEHDAAILVAPSASGSARGSLPQVSPELLSVLRMARQGRGSTAKAILDRPEVRAEAVQLVSLMTPDQLLAACTARQLSPEQLQQLLSAEIALDNVGGPAIPSVAPEVPPARWSEAVKTSGLSALPVLSLDKLTEFDPAACVFRNGKWTRP